MYVRFVGGDRSHQPGCGRGGGVGAGGERQIGEASGRGRECRRVLFLSFRPAACTSSVECMFDSLVATALTSPAAAAVGAWARVENARSEKRRVGEESAGVCSSYLFGRQPAHLVSNVCSFRWWRPLSPARLRPRWGRVRGWRTPDRRSVG